MDICLILTSLKGFILPAWSANIKQFPVLLIPVNYRIQVKLMKQFVFRYGKCVIANNRINE